MEPALKQDDPFTWLPDGSPAGRSDDRLPARRPPAVRRARRRAGWLTTLEWALLVVGALVVALLIKAFLFQAFYIPSESMMPTLREHDRVLVNKLSYRLHAVRRGDVVVFKAPAGADPTVKDLVKRVIGLPGETIEARDGRVYIDGEAVDEPWLPDGVRTTPGFAPIKIPPDSYYVLGDNRANSKDSRYFPAHFVPADDIVGRVFLRIWPLTRVDIL